jgi:hypothetical protein
LANDWSGKSVKILTYEFVIPSELFIADLEPWPDIIVVHSGLRMTLHKPIAGNKLVRADNTLGNEGVVIGYSVVRVGLVIPDEAVNPEWAIPFQLVKQCLDWIRVAAKQYWIGTLMSFSNSFARGSIITVLNGETSHQNFGASKMRIPPQPLTKGLWLQIGEEIANGRRPGIPDIMFCDALLHYREDDYLQTVIQFGVACELELNALIDDLLSLKEQSLQKLYGATRLPFRWKLLNMPGILGIQPYQEHNERFAGLICALYELRGSAVHRAQCLVEIKNSSTGKKEKIPVDFANASQFLFAVQDFLTWSKEQKHKSGILKPTVSSEPMQYLIGPPI